MALPPRIAPSQAKVDSQASNTCQVLFIRHGERADFAADTNIKYDVPSDPPLTKLGIEQAKEAGRLLKVYIAAQKFDEVIIECSPFIRTVQTASYIAKELGHQAPIRVQYRHAEWLFTYYKEDPLPELNIRNRAKEEIVRDYTKGVDFVHFDEEGFRQLKYPEGDFFDLCERIRGVSEDLLKTYERSSKRVLHLVATHGAGVKGFSYSFNTPILPNWCSYCAVSGIEVQGKAWRMIFSEQPLKGPKL